MEYSKEDYRRQKKRKLSNFSYTVARSLFRRRNNFNFVWTIYEKGYNKPTLTNRYEISYDKIKKAATLLQLPLFSQFYLRKRPRIFMTPCEKSIYLFERNNFNVYLKKEFYQRYDSVKARGVIYSLQQLTDEQKLKGVIAISTGSFALILCYFGLMFNIPITVVMPTEALEEKVNMCRQYNSSRIIVKGNNLLEAHRFAIDIAMKDDLYYLDGNDHPNMIIGQATIGLEILKQRKIDVVLLPTLIDGCGLTTAIAIAIKGTNPKIVVIEVLGRFCNLFQEVKQETDYIRELKISAEEYIGCPLRNVPNCVIDRFISVSSTFVHSAFLHLYKYESIYDYHGAIALAAILSGQLDDLRNKKIVIPLYGRMDIREEDYIDDKIYFSYPPRSL